MLVSIGSSLCPRIELTVSRWMSPRLEITVLAPIASDMKGVQKNLMPSKVERLVRVVGQQTPGSELQKEQKRGAL